MCSDFLSISPETHAVHCFEHTFVAIDNCDILAIGEIRSYKEDRNQCSGFIKHVRVTKQALSSLLIQLFI